MPGSAPAQHPGTTSLSKCQRAVQNENQPLAEETPDIEPAQCGCLPAWKNKPVRQSHLCKPPSLAGMCREMLRSPWRYRLTLTGPTHTCSIMVPAAGVLHFKWAHHGYETGYGKSPLEAVRTTLTILSNTAARLAEESGAPSGYLLPLPDRGDQAGGKSDDARAIFGHLTGVIEQHWDAVCQEAELSEVDKKLFWRRQLLNPYSTLH